MQNAVQFERDKRLRDHRPESAQSQFTAGDFRLLVEEHQVPKYGTLQILDVGKIQQ